MDVVCHLPIRAWYPRWDSSPHNLVFETSTYTYSVTWAYLVLPSRIELLSEALQAPAMTTSAKAAY
jgi:hypothetical protein